MKFEILFHIEDVNFELEKPDKIESWLSQTASEEGHEAGVINYIFCSDEYLLSLNKEYLKHFDYTDVITFQYNEPAEAIAGDCFISIDRVKENAGQYNVGFADELNRVLVHGLLHLCGYGDKSTAESELMKQKEDYYLEKY